jgi:hypothetical protein
MRAPRAEISAPLPFCEDGATVIANRIDVRANPFSDLRIIRDAHIPQAFHLGATLRQLHLRLFRNRGVSPIMGQTSHFDFSQFFLFSFGFSFGDLLLRESARKQT